MKFCVREMGVSDAPSWARMRLTLWPEDSAAAHQEAIAELLPRDDAFGLIAESASGEAAGFCEIEIRRYANSCLLRPVPFLEGIWVATQFRRKGVGAQLIHHAEARLLARGFREFGSDARMDNPSSHKAHAAWGSYETERVVYFRKPIGPKE